MSQSKRHSALETATNTAVGFVGSYFITYACFHLPAETATELLYSVLRYFHWATERPTELAAKTLYATLGCTAWSLLRGYYMRRLFNYLHTKPARELLSPTAESDHPYDDSLCDHVFVDGFGGMGDALTCCECGLSKYPEALPADMLEIARRRHRVIESSHPQYRLYVEKVQALQRAKAQ